MNKIGAYLKVLEEKGTRVGYPVVEYMNDSLWELRPLAHRIFFFYWKDNTFILLSHYVKKSQKTPPLELEKAKAYMKDWKERNK